MAKPLKSGSLMPARPALFLDRDGVINADKGYTFRESELEFCSGFIEGLIALRELGFHLIVVSNQSGIARNYFSIADVLLFHQAINRQLAALKAPTIDLFIFCPHLPQALHPEFAIRCSCRKPSPGMIAKGGKIFNIDWAKSWLIGDRWSDIEAAVKSHLKSVQIISTLHPEIHLKADICVQNFEEAAYHILSCS